MSENLTIRCYFSSLSRHLSESIKHWAQCPSLSMTGAHGIAKSKYQAQSGKGVQETRVFPGLWGRQGTCNTISHFLWVISSNSDPQKLPFLHVLGSASLVWWPSVGMILVWSSWDHSGHTLAGCLGSSGSLSPQHTHPRTQLPPASPKGRSSAGCPPCPLILGGSIMPHTPESLSPDQISLLSSRPFHPNACGGSSISIQ